MIKTKLKVGVELMWTCTRFGYYMSQGGRHVMPQDAEDYSTEELQLMKTQDDKYIQMKLASETKVESKGECRNM